ncbi:MAG: O-methyltransferase [Rikenellaceae bacterium]
MEAIDRYILDHTTAEDLLLKELDRETHLRVVQPRMLSGHIQGRLLSMMTQMIRPRRVLEIGTFTGYSALCIAAGMESGTELHTVEVDDELESLSSSFFERSEHREKIFAHIGSALEVAPKLGGRFDLVFMDGDKREYPDYLTMLLDEGLVGSGSFIIADNILWSGKVVEPLQRNDRHTAALLRFNRMVVEDSRLECVIIPLRDGLNLIRVK